jgi:hypothetical protein
MLIVTLPSPSPLIDPPPHSRPSAFTHPSPLAPFHPILRLSLPSRPCPSPPPVPITLHPNLDRTPRPPPQLQIDFLSPTNRTPDSKRRSSTRTRTTATTRLSPPGAAGWATLPRGRGVGIRVSVRIPSLPIPSFVVFGAVAVSTPPRFESATRSAFPNPVLRVALSPLRLPIVNEKFDGC